MGKLCDHTEVSLGFKGIQHLYDVLMTQVPQDFDLLSQVPDVLLTLAMLHDELHSSDLASEFSAPFINLW